MRGREEVELEEVENDESEADERGEARGKSVSMVVGSCAVVVRGKR